MKAVILDYSTPSVDVLHIPDSLVHTEEIESYIVHRGYRLADIYWMSVPDDTYIPVCDAENGRKLLFTL